ncbi:hypothetical protein RHK26_00020 [Clostridioides difficile]|nr:hypothetical protein [Clostridioides difficile]
MSNSYPKLVSSAALFAIIFFFIFKVNSSPSEMISSVPISSDVSNVYVTGFCSTVSI